jgi:hypothetical protein
MDRSKLPPYFRMDDDPENLAIWAAHQMLDAMLEGTVAQSGGISRESTGYAPDPPTGDK